MWQADTLDQAIRRAEREAEDYAGSLGVGYTGLAQAYGPLDDDPRDGSRCSR